jgi:putative hemolysin
MDLPLGYEILAILIFVAANGFFALSEFSIIASRRSRLIEESERGDVGALYARKLNKRPERFLASVQIGITLFGTLAGVFGGATIVVRLEAVLAAVPVSTIANVAGGLSMAIVAVGITITSVVLGELVPKYLALSNPERFASFVSRPMTAFTRLTSFLATGLSGAAALTVRLLGVRPDQVRPDISEEEINYMIFEGKQKGVFDDVEERLIKSAFDFADSTVRRAMTPRPDVVAIDINSPPEQILDIITSHGYSRYPVFDSDIDHIVGILYTKDLIYQKLDPRLVVFKDLIREAFFVPDSLPLSRLLSQFQRRRLHVAIVLDEYGGTAGLITIEDIVEELVGEIRDEYDAEEAPLVRHSEDVAYASGDVWPGDVNNLMETHLPEDDVDSLSGLLMEHLGRLPGQNETVRIADTDIRILTVKGNRLLRLKLERVKQNAES